MFGKNFKRSKYGNKKVTLGDIEFASKKEMERYVFLKDAEDKGLIRNLQRQKTFELIPKVTEKVVKHLKTKDKIEEKFVQHPITYTCDFYYEKDFQFVVEDVKASSYFLDEVYKIKEKLFRWKYGYSITRIMNPTEPI